MLVFCKDLLLQSLGDFPGSYKQDGISSLVVRCCSVTVIHCPWAQYPSLIRPKTLGMILVACSGSITEEV